ncbi:MAG: hypothetical protein AAF928_19400 [Myxococcota bacterium]
METDCAPSVQACVADEDCQVLLTCVQACEEEACPAACVAASPAGAPLAVPILDCASASCSEDCAASGLF